MYKKNAIHFLIDIYSFYRKFYFIENKQSVDTTRKTEKNKP